MVKPTNLKVFTSAACIASTSGGGAEPKYKGVRKRKWGKWVSEIRLPNSRERIWLGSYDTPEKVAHAFDAAVFCLRGRKARFNFPDSPADLPSSSLAPSEIQSIAAKFAVETQDQKIIQKNHTNIYVVRSM